MRPNSGSGITFGEAAANNRISAQQGIGESPCGAGVYVLCPYATYALTLRHRGSVLLTLWPVNLNAVILRAPPPRLLTCFAGPVTGCTGKPQHQQRSTECRGIKFLMAVIPTGKVQHGEPFDFS